jgi:hypothetical protein
VARWVATIIRLDFGPFLRASAGAGCFSGRRARLTGIPQGYAAHAGALAAEAHEAWRQAALALVDRRLTGRQYQRARTPSG